LDFAAFFFIFGAFMFTAPLSTPLSKTFLAARLSSPLVALAAAALVALSSTAQAQSSPAAPSAAKTELVAKVLQLQRPGIEGMATLLAQQPAQQMMQSVSVALQTRFAPDKREAIAKDIQEDLNKYLNDAIPLLRERAVKLAPSSIGVLLEEKFSEDELKQLIAIMESPVNKKFGQLNGEIQRTLAEKLVADTRPQIDAKVKLLDESIGKRLGAPVKAEAPAKAASKPVAKPAAK
jgi:hypothetical protein